MNERVKKEFNKSFFLIIEDSRTPYNFLKKRKENED